MKCNCLKLIEYGLKASRGRARQAQIENARKLEAFRNGIREGAMEVAARHVYRAGVYLASLEGGLKRNPGEREILAALERNLRKHPALTEFFGRNVERIRAQAIFVDARRMLRRILKQKGRAVGLLKGNAERELTLAREALERVRRLEERLATWREASHLEALVEAVKIYDVHS